MGRRLQEAGQVFPRLRHPRQRTHRQLVNHFHHARQKHHLDGIAFEALTDIPEYVSTCFKGDCGVQALFFITMCRAAGNNQTIIGPAK